MQRFIQACMELINCQEYISWKLPPGWTILLTSNPDEGEEAINYIVTSLDNAQKSRYMSVQLKFDAKCWAEWAEGRIDPRCINFILLNPEIVKNEVNPRLLEMYFNMVSTIKDFEKALPKIQALGEASVGENVALMFSMFINNKLDKLINPEKLYTGDIKTVIKEIDNSINVNGEKRNDIASVLTIRFTNFILNHDKTETVTIDHIDRIEELIKSGILGEDNNYSLVRNLVKAKSQQFKVFFTRKTIMKITEN